LGVCPTPSLSSQPRRNNNNNNKKKNTQQQQQQQPPLHPSMAYVHELCGSKLKSKLSTLSFNEAATAAGSMKPNNNHNNNNPFAQRQLERMGWSLGEGLGKHRQGIRTHVTVKVREEQVGLGHGSVVLSSMDNVSTPGWWNDSMNTIFAKLGSNHPEGNIKKKKKKKKKEEEEKEKKNKKKEKKIKKKTKKEAKEKRKKKEIIHTITDEDLFRATGGKRFGMRARRKQIGKWARTESNLSSQEQQDIQNKLEWNGLGPAKLVLSSSLSTATVSTNSLSTP
jgi:hypothetical protein